MNPDYSALVNEFIKPVGLFFVFALMILGWVIAYQLMKEVTELKMRLGREAEQEDFKFWILRKTAPIVAPVYSVYNLGLYMLVLIKNGMENKRKAIRFAAKFTAAIGTVLSSLPFAAAGSNSEGGK